LGVKLSNSKKIRIGTRGSPLALRQVEMVRAALGPGVESETVVIKTSGDWRAEDGERRLADSGGKGLFAREIEQALLAGDIDCAVHSMKDMESELPEGLIVEHMLPRGDVRDALISREGQILEDLPERAAIGTASMRRQAFLLAKRPDLKIVSLRGNVQTRLDKLNRGDVDATLLAVAGLKRLGLEGEITQIIEPEEMLPSAGQGTIGIETREGDVDMIAVFSQINCVETTLRVTAEREVLRILSGSCHTPVGVFALVKNGQMSLRAKLASPDGRKEFFEEAEGKVMDPETAKALGRGAGEKLKAKVPKELL